VTTFEPSPRSRNVAGLIGFVLAVVLTIAEVVQAGLGTAIPLLAYRNGVGAGQIGVMFLFVGIGHLIFAVITDFRRRSQRSRSVWAPAERSSGWPGSSSRRSWVSPSSEPRLRGGENRLNGPGDLADCGQPGPSGLETVLADAVLGFVGCEALVDELIDKAGV
jgi:hypothetical protein